ncbi:hypothetical protein CR513_24448, partial [Mucuna pruriens]
MEELKNAKGLKLPFPRETALKKDAIKSEMEAPNIASSKAYALAHLLCSTYDKHLSIFPLTCLLFATLGIYYYSRDQNSPSNSCLRTVVPHCSLNFRRDSKYGIVIRRPLDGGELWANKIDPLCYHGSDCITTRWIWFSKLQFLTTNTVSRSNFMKE